MRRSNFLWAAFIPRSIVTNIATCGPVGTLMKAPGTWGSVIGIFLFVAVFMNLSNLFYLVLLLMLTYLAMGICNEAEIRFGKKDPGFVIIDEVIAIPFCFAFLFPPDAATTILLWPWLLLGFLLFRLFDITKPLFIGQLQKIGGGFGVVIDDVAAAIVTNIILQILFKIVYG
jgi:phosphatidylglycerophosphatase A